MMYNPDDISKLMRYTKYEGALVLSKEANIRLLPRFKSKSKHYYGVLYFLYIMHAEYGDVLWDYIKTTKPNRPRYAERNTKILRDRVLTDKSLGDLASEHGITRTTIDNILCHQCRCILHPAKLKTVIYNIEREIVDD